MNNAAPSTSEDARGDLAAAAAVLAVFFAHGVTQRAVIDTPLEHVMYEALTALVMLAIVVRARSGWFATPSWSRPVSTPSRLIRVQSSMRVVLAGAITASVALVVRGLGEQAASLVWQPSVQGDLRTGSGCRSYNDPACSGDDVVVDMLEVLTASLGEEFAYRFAMLVIATRFAGVRVAVGVPAVVWALSHTGFENGYGAPVVIGLGAAGVVYAVVVVLTRSIWPAVIAHAIHNLGVAAYDHDLNAVMWIVLTLNALGAASVVAAAALWAMRRGGQWERSPIA